MNSAQLKAELYPYIKTFETLQYELGKVLGTVKATVNAVNASGDNTVAMEDVIRLLNNPTCPQTLKPILNRIHKALWKNAQFNLQESIREKTEELAAMMPGQMKPRKRSANPEGDKKGSKEPIKHEAEITSPDALLQLADNDRVQRAIAEELSEGRPSTFAYMNK